MNTPKQITHVLIPVETVNAVLKYLTKTPLPFEDTVDLILPLRGAAEASARQQQVPETNA